MNNYHKSVLLQEVIGYLQVEKGKQYIDATLGGGGHTEAILEKGGKVLGIDVDEDAIAYVQERIMNKNNLHLAVGNFNEIDNIAKENSFEKVAGLLFDLGVSGHQFETSER